MRRSIGGRRRAESHMAAVAGRSCRRPLLAGYSASLPCAFWIGRGKGGDHWEMGWQLGFPHVQVVGEKNPQTLDCRWLMVVGQVLQRMVSKHRQQRPCNSAPSHAYQIMDSVARF